VFHSHCIVNQEYKRILFFCQPLQSEHQHKLTGIKPSNEKACETNTVNQYTDMSLLDLKPPRDYIAAIEADLRINIHELGVDVKELELSGNLSTIV
jgi:hypothetical protein